MLTEWTGEWTLRSMKEFSFVFMSENKMTLRLYMYTSCVLCDKTLHSVAYRCLVYVLYIVSNPMHPVKHSYINIYSIPYDVFMTFTWLVNPMWEWALLVSEAPLTEHHTVSDGMHTSSNEPKPVWFDRDPVRPQNPWTVQFLPLQWRTIGHSNLIYSLHWKPLTA